MAEAIHQTPNHNSQTNGQEFCGISAKYDISQPKEKDEIGVMQQPFGDSVIRNLPAKLSPGSEVEDSFIKHVQGDVNQQRTQSKLVEIQIA